MEISKLLLNSVWHGSTILGEERTFQHFYSIIFDHNQLRMWEREGWRKLIEQGKEEKGGNILGSKEV